MNENIPVVIRQFTGYLEDHPNEAFSFGEVLFRLSKDLDCSPREVFKEIVRRLRDG